MIRKFMDHREIWVRIPARIAGISRTVCRIPVTAPAAIPASIDNRSAASGSRSKLMIRVAQTHPPRAKLPSTVRSAISRSR